MKIILLKDVSKLGRRFDTKEVSDGHALNLLIPRGLALAATPDAVKRVAALKAKADGDRKVQEELLAKNLKQLDDVSVTIQGKANEKGHLFAGLHREEIAAALNEQAKIQVDPSFIKLEHPLKEVGEHKLEIEAGGKKAQFTVLIEAK